MPSGSIRSQYSQKFAKSRSSTSHPIVQFDRPTSFAPRGASVPMRSISTCSGERTLSGELDGAMLYRPPYATRANTAAVMHAVVLIIFPSPFVFINIVQGHNGPVKRVLCHKIPRRAADLSATRQSQ